ncbi:MAG: S8 family serine peptidase [Acidobacteriota bacterium]
MKTRFDHLRRHLITTCTVIAFAVAGAVRTPTSAVEAQTMPAGAKLDPTLVEAMKSIEPGCGPITTENGLIYRKDGRLRVVVVMSNPTDIVELQRGAANIDALRSSVRLRQDRFIARLGAGDVHNVVRLDLQCAFSGFADSAAMRKIASLPEVEMIVPDYLREQFTVEGRALATSDAAEATYGFTGSGMSVAMIDGSFDYTHEWFGHGTVGSPDPSVIVGMRDLSGNAKVGDPGAVQADDEVYPEGSDDDPWHATGTSGIVRKYAPGAKLALLKVFPNAYDSVIGNAINWAVIHQYENPASPIRLINMSLGGGRYSGDCPTGVIQSAIDIAKAANIICVVATGNQGYDRMIASPGCDPDVIAVGSVFDADNAYYSPFPPRFCVEPRPKKDHRICYSNASPSLDMYAPSEEVMTALAGSGNLLTRLGGTSSASPALAGCAAQILEAKPGLIGDKSGLLDLLQRTGDQIEDNPDPSYEDRRVNVVAAITDGAAGAQIQSFVANPGAIVPGESSTLSWSCTNTLDVTVSGTPGKLPPSGTLKISPETSTVYTLTARGVAGNATATVTVLVNSPTAAMDVNPPSAIFGPVPVGDSSVPVLFTITNTGSGDLLIGTITVDGPDASDFSLDLGSVSGDRIAPSQTQSFQVVFQPESQGVKQATVTVASNAGIVHVQVYGTGTLDASAADLKGAWSSLKRKSSTLTGRLTCANGGKTPASGFTVALFMSKNARLDPSDTPVGSKAVSGLAAQGAITVKIGRVKVPAKCHYIIAVIDPTNAVPETDELNNRVISTKF